MHSNKTYIKVNQSVSVAPVCTCESSDTVVHMDPFLRGHSLRRLEATGLICKMSGESEKFITIPQSSMTSQNTKDISFKTV